MYPMVEIHTKGILQNLEVLRTLTRRQGIRISVVTKGLVGYEPLVKKLIENGVDSICEASVKNLKLYEKYDVEKWMIRLPLISQAAEVVRYADVSLNSELATVQRLSEEAQKQGRVHKVVIMLELGELREGCSLQELLPLCKACEELPGVELHGIGNNLSCYSEIIPDDENMAVFAKAVRDVEAMIGRKLCVVSGGNTSSCYRLQQGTLPKEINHLRLGEAVLIGNIACYNETIQGGSDDNFTLTTEIIEIKEKPSMPYGSRAPGVCPVGQSGEFIDRGLRKRALIAVGKQDINIYALFPHDKDMEILAGTSDCFIADITNCKKEYRVGDAVQFSMNYFSMLPAMASDYIEKVMVE